MVWLFALYFYPRPPRGGRPAKAVPIAPATEFLSTSPARGTTHSVMLCQPLFANFYPRPPRGGRLSRVDFIVCQKTFLSTSPARGTTLCSTQNAAGRKISIHVPREGDDVDLFEVEIASSNFYPRPPRGGRPASPLPPAAGLFYFYPRPPRGGRPPDAYDVIPEEVFLSTSPARGTTAWRVWWEEAQMNFYPRPPRGGRPG